MQAVADYIVYYVSGVIDLFDDGVFSLILFFVMAATIVGIFAWTHFVDFIMDKLFKRGIPGFIIGMLVFTALTAAVYYSVDIMFWVLDAIILGDIE